MKVKLFWAKAPVQGLFSTVNPNDLGMENEINAWLREHPHIKVVDIRQSATGGSFGRMVFSISVWYEEGGA
ncbi:MAG: hypothetical protein ABSG86_01045 [Thermoguttaceae bacterium]|jgi:hypothetical protein